MRYTFFVYIFVGNLRCLRVRGFGLVDLVMIYNGNIVEACSIAAFGGEGAELSCFPGVEQVVD